MSPRWLYWPGAAGPDWDTNADGVMAGYWTQNNSVPVSNSWYADKTLVSSTTYSNAQNTGSNSYMKAVYITGQPYLELYNASTNLPPWVAVWDTTDEVWHTAAGGGTSGSTQRRYPISGLPDVSGGSTYRTIIVVYHSGDPGSTAGWRAYDGPAHGL